LIFVHLPEFLVTPLHGAACLLSQGRLEDPVRPWNQL